MKGQNKPTEKPMHVYQEWLRLARSRKGGRGRHHCGDNCMCLPRGAEKIVKGFEDQHEKLGLERPPRLWDPIWRADDQFDSEFLGL